MSGGVEVNDGLFHVGQHDLPFGGVGESGMGPLPRLRRFCHLLQDAPGVYQAPFSAMKFLWPPYSDFATKYLHFLTKRLIHDHAKEFDYVIVIRRWVGRVARWPVV